MQGGFHAQELGEVPGLANMRAGVVVTGSSRREDAVVVLLWQLLVELKLERI
jgi:hypothetical protein